MSDLVERIQALKEERDAVILSHYYVDGEIQRISDYVGDSFFLSKIAAGTQHRVIVLCGVYFMGESAKILSPDKIVLIPDASADCPMAHMIDKERIEEVRVMYEDVAVVCYVNSTAEIKSYSDICVTSANALDIVSKLPNKRIFFIPDNNLGRYLAGKLPEKEFIFHDGFCHVHTSITRENILKARAMHPEALILAHPECTMDVLEMADYVGSTSGIIDYARESEGQSFIICTEMGVFFELARENPGKRFYSVGHRQFCPNMKRLSLEKLCKALETMEPEIHLDEEMRVAAFGSLDRMLKVAEL